MSPKNFALFGGILMLVLGAVALIPSMVGPVEGLPALYLETSYGLFLGLFAMNIVNKVALIVFGLAGIAASSMRFNALPVSIWFSRAVFFVMGAGAILGMIPQTNTFFGYWPLFGYEVVLHGVFAVIGAYFGFALTLKVKNEIRTNPKLKATFQGR